jgi:hypothetical protein
MEMTEFEQDVQLKRKPGAGLAAARAALQIVEEIYKKSKKSDL